MYFQMISFGLRRERAFARDRSKTDESAEETRKEAPLSILRHILNNVNFLLMSKTFIVAELSANHAGSLDTAKATIRAAARAGADAVKLQTYTPDSLTLPVAGGDFQLHGGLWDGRNLYELYQEATTPYEWHAELFDLARSLGLVCFSTPFDRDAVDLLESLGNPIYKIASFEVMDTDLIGYAASKHKPMVISTGVATDREIREAIDACHAAGNDDVTLLKCTSAYPAEIADANLSMIPAMRERYGVAVGLSDHSAGSMVPVVATALGAVMIEKHFILDRSVGGPDAAFSMDAAEFEKMVRDVRLAEDSLGTIDFDRAAEADGRKWSRSLYVSAPIAEGEAFSRENVRCVRPGYSLHPRHFADLIGRCAAHPYLPGDRIEPDALQNKR